MSREVFDVVIAGAGVTGLVAGRTLQTAKQAVLLERREVAGGRLQSCTIGAGIADIGAQYLTVRTPEFAAISREWQELGLIQPWVTGWSDLSLGDYAVTPNPRYIAGRGMASLTEYLAQGLEVRSGRTITGVKPEGDGWQIQVAGDHFYYSHALLLTLPAPEALSLLAAGETQLSASNYAALEQITYDPSLVAVFALAGETKMPALGAIQLPDSPIRFLIDNQRKGISSQATVLTAQANGEYSRANWHLNDQELLAQIRDVIHIYLQPDARVLEERLFRWQYAIPVTLHPQLCLKAEDLPPLIFAGDAYGTLRGIEGAALSGLAAGGLLAQVL